MDTLHTALLSPAGRFVRLVLAEKRLEFQLAPAEADALPVLVTAEGHEIADALPIVEYLEETGAGQSLLPDGALARAEVRRLTAAFLHHFEMQVTQWILPERLRRLDADGARLRVGLDALKAWMAEIGMLAEARRWLGGEQITLADFAAAAQLSALDYTGDIAWRASEQAKDWYARMKSRPSFRALLVETVPGLPPARHYALLDF